MAETPDTGKGWFIRTLFRFLGTTTGLIVVCVVLNATGVVKWADLVDLRWGRQQATADTGKTDPPKPGADGKIGPRSDEGRKPVPVPPKSVVPPNAPPRVNADPSMVEFKPDDRTKQITLSVADEEPAGVAVKAGVTPVPKAGLLSANGVKLEGTGGTRFLTVIPDPDKWGEATIRVTATDAAGLTCETTVRVKVPEPAFAIRDIPGVSVTVGDPIPVLIVTVDDAARKPGKVSIRVIANDSLIPVENVKYDPAGRKLTLTPKPRGLGSATITLIAKTDDGREARRSFIVTVNPKPLRAGSRATLVIAIPEGDLDFDAKGLNKVLGSPALDADDTVDVKDIVGKRCRIEWKAGGKTITGWVDKDILKPVQDP